MWSYTKIDLTRSARLPRTHITKHMQQMYKADHLSQPRSSNNIIMILLLLLLFIHMRLQTV